MAVLTVDDLRIKYGFSFPASKDAQFTEYINSSEAACLKYLDRSSFETAEITQYFDGNVTNRYVLDYSPVKSITSITLRDGTELSEDDYRVDSNGILTFYRIHPTEGLDAMKVEYECGWDNVPSDIKYCIAMTVQYLAKMMATNQAGVSTRNTEGGTESLEQNIPPLAVQKLLSNYRFMRAK